MQSDETEAPQASAPQVDRLPKVPRLFDPKASVDRRTGAYLPHWTQETCTYFVTYRLSDSLPQEKLRQWKAERKRLELRCATGNITEVERKRLQRILVREYQEYLDQGLGSCVLKIPEVGQLVHEALQYFDTTRYALWAWCIMPNHVHAVLEPLGENKLEQILHTWRSYTAHEINKTLHRKGPLWQQEPFDHAIRTQASFEWCVEYTYNNPTAAGLRKWPWRGRKEFHW